MTTEARCLRAYLQVNDWQARDLDMNGSCGFVPSVGKFRVAFRIHWKPEMIETEIYNACDLIASYENYRNYKHGTPRTVDDVRADLPIAYELIKDAA